VPVLVVEEDIELVVPTVDVALDFLDEGGQDLDHLVEDTLTLKVVEVRLKVCGVPTMSTADEASGEGLVLVELLDQAIAASDLDVVDALRHLVDRKPVEDQGLCRADDELFGEEVVGLASVLVASQSKQRGYFRLTTGLDALDAHRAGAVHEPGNLEAVILASCREYAQELVSEGIILEGVRHHLHGVSSERKGERETV